MGGLLPELTERGNDLTICVQCEDKRLICRYLLLFTGTANRTPWQNPMVPVCVAQVANYSPWLSWDSYSTRESAKETYLRLISVAQWSCWLYG